MKRSRHVVSFATALCVLPLLAAAQEAAPAPGAAPEVNAVWVERTVSFTYVPLTTYYSCDGLRDKVRWILGELGARPGFKVKTHGCVEVQGPERFPGVDIVAAFPAAATPELLAQLAGEATAQFPARVRRVEFNSVRTAQADLQDGDCELIEQLLRHDVFGKFGVKVVDASVSCVPRQVTLGAVRMAVEVLEPVPRQ